MSLFFALSTLVFFTFYTVCLLRSSCGVCWGAEALTGEKGA